MQSLCNRCSDTTKFRILRNMLALLHFYEKPENIINSKVDVLADEHSEA